MQLGFDFKNDNKFYTEDFIVFDGNKEAFDFATGKLKDEHNRIILITGSERSGKTHLCHIWQRECGAIFLNIQKMNEITDARKFYSILTNFIEMGRNYILEDLENVRLEEEKLLHLINIINEKRAELLITSAKFVSEFFFEIKDLQSRFINIINLKIGDLHGEAKKLFIVKLFSDRQMQVDAKVIDWLAEHSPVSYVSIINMIKKIVFEFEQSKRKKITLNFVKNINRL